MKYDFFMVIDIHKFILNKLQVFFFSFLFEKGILINIFFTIFIS